MAAGFDTGRPAEENIAGGLHGPLPLDDALAETAELAPRQVALEYRRHCLLHLEEQRVSFVAAL